MTPSLPNFGTIIPNGGSSSAGITQFRAHTIDFLFVCLKERAPDRYREGTVYLHSHKSEIWYLPMEANIDLSKISPTLFLDFTAQSLTYLLKPCKEARLIEEIIHAGNGAMVNEVGLYTITLISPDEDYNGDEEVFSTKYIEDCARENKQLNLNNYRCANLYTYLATAVDFPRHPQ
uniref:BRCT domain-containing protein n=1 Tax=Timema bartmani TaxID=61472 RepID=A0A7R9I827_9NEOP|nr:unnamed protein product [Timema bartmani]